MSPTRVRIATNIREDDTARIAVAKVGTRRQEKRFPKATPIRDITIWIEDTRRHMRKVRKVAQRLKGTPMGDVAAYVGTLPKGRGRDNVRACLMAWVLALGECKRADLTVEQLRAVIVRWLEAGVAANTIKHRRRALAQLYDRLDGPEGNIVRTLKTPREPDAEPRGVDMAVLDAILNTMDSARSVRHPGRGGTGFRNKTQARLRMMLWTGLSPASLKRLKPHAIDLARETITLPARQKGRGAQAVTLELFPSGLDACRQWLRAFAWGAFDQRALARCFHAAVRRYVQQEAEKGQTVTVPADLRVYDLRHSFLSWLWAETEDALIVQHFAQHLDLETTRRYTRGAVHALARGVVERVRQKQTAPAVGTEQRKWA